MMFRRKNKKKPVPHYPWDNPPTPKTLSKRMKNQSTENKIEFIATGYPTAVDLSVLAKDLDVKVQEAVAENPYTPAFTLDHLGSSPSENVVEKVAKNLSTPSDTLRRLFHTAESLGASNVARLVLLNPQCPTDVLEEVLSEGLGETLLLNPCLTPTMLENIFENSLTEHNAFHQAVDIFLIDPDDESARGFVYRYTGTDTVAEATSELEETMENRQEHFELMCEIIAMHPNTPASLLARLVACDPVGDDLLLDVAENPNTSSEELFRILTKGPFPAFIAAAENPNLSPAHIREYVTQHLNPDKREPIIVVPDPTDNDVFGNDQEFDDIFASMMDEMKEFANLASYYKNSTSKETQRSLLDPNEDVFSPPSAWFNMDDDAHYIPAIITLASNPSTPPDIQLQMFQYGPLSLAELIALNSSAPDYVLTAIYQYTTDQDDMLEQQYLDTQTGSDKEDEAEKHHELHHSKQLLEDIWCAIAENPNCPTHLFDSMARMGNTQLLLCLASNNRVPASILASLIAHPSQRLHVALAANLATAENTLAYLALSPHWQVRRNLAENPNVPEHLLSELLQDCNAQVARSAQLRYYFRSRAETGQ